MGVAIIECGTQMDARERDHVLRLAERWHVPVEDRPAGYWAWDGTTISLQERFSTVLHEMAHYLVCCALAPERLPSAAFGYPPNAEEELASVLGIEWQRRGRFPWLDTVGEHNWEDGDRREPRLEYWDRVEELVGMGLLPARRSRP